MVATFTKPKAIIKEPGLDRRRKELVFIESPSGRRTYVGVLNRKINDMFYLKPLRGDREIPVYTNCVIEVQVRLGDSSRYFSRRYTVDLSD